MTPKQHLILWAVAELKAIDAERGDDDEALVEYELLQEQPTAQELRAIANELKTYLIPEMGHD